MTLKEMALKINKELEELMALSPARYVFSWHINGENVGLSAWKKEDNENIRVPHDPMEFIITNNGTRVRQTGRYDIEECNKVVSELIADIEDSYEKYKKEIDNVS